MSWFGWGATILDAIGTAIIMNETDVVAKQLAFIEKIDFSKTEKLVVSFKSNIRNIGGLLSAYDLLKSGQFPNPYEPAHVEALLKQAKVLADQQAYGFNTPSGTVAASVNFTSNEPLQENYTVRGTNVTYNSANTASTGTFVLEWARLSDLAGNETYRRLTERAQSWLVNSSPAPTYPGLVDTQFDLASGAMLNLNGGWHAGVDSFLVYLIKLYQSNPTATTTFYKDCWLSAVKSTNDHIAIPPFGFPDLKFISYLHVNCSLMYLSDCFTCFAGGNILLGAHLRDIPGLMPSVSRRRMAVTGPTTPRSQG